MGTWKLNEAKSKFAPGTTKNNTVVYAAAGDNVKVTVDGVDRRRQADAQRVDGQVRRQGLPGHRRSDLGHAVVQEVDDHTLALTVKKGGKVTITGHIVVSADGKSRTVTTSGTDAKGARVHQHRGLRQAVVQARSPLTSPPAAGEGRGEGGALLLSSRHLIPSARISPRSVRLEPTPMLSRSTPRPAVYVFRLSRVEDGRGGIHVTTKE